MGKLIRGYGDEGLNGGYNKTPLVKRLYLMKNYLDPLKKVRASERLLRKRPPFLYFDLLIERKMN